MEKKLLSNRYIIFVLFLLNSILLLAAPTVIVTKSDIFGAPLSATYDTGDQVVFKVRVSNPDATALNGIKVAMPLSGITSTLDGGGTSSAFSNLINQVGSKSPSANAGSIGLTGDFEATGISIPAGGFIEYFVLGTVNQGVNGSLTPVATLSSGNTQLATGSATLTRVPYGYSISKSSPTTYYEKDGKVTYKIVIANTSDNIAIKDITLEDILPPELTGAVITATATGGSSIGTFSSTGNLLATGITITPKNKVEYTIVADVKPGTTTPINNTASVTVRNKKELSPTVILDSAKYDFIVGKTSPTPSYIPGQNYTYNVRITNNSASVPITKLKVEDILSTMTATSAGGSVKPVFASGTINITAATFGNSSAGVFNSIGDLIATDVNIPTGGFVEYTITGKINDDIVGEIQNTVKVIDRNAVEKTSTLLSSSVAPTLNLTKVQSKATYKPGETITYTVTVENKGTGIASNYLVEDLLDTIKGNVGNNSAVNAADVSATSLLNSWTVNAVVEGGAKKSLSAIVTNGGTTSNTNLLDIVTVFPGEKIVYTITTIAKDTSISDIVNKVDLKKAGTTPITATVTAKPVALANNNSIVITKVPTQIEYKPGDTITYTLTVTNAENSFMNNVSINDLINSIKATQIDGSLGPAFDSWDLSVLSFSGTGTSPGTGIITNASGNLAITADIGPTGTIVYEIKAKTKLTTVGTIVDDKPLVGDNVLETGPGVKMSTPILEIAKNVNTTEYVPGGTLTYTIDVDNPGDGYATNVLVADKLSAVTTQLIDGTTGPAFQSWVITSKVYNISSATPTLVTSPTDPTSAGTYSPTADLDVKNVILGPNRRITYTVVTTLNPKAKGSIKNSASVNGLVYSDKGSQTKSSKISIAKSSPTAIYSVGDTTTIEYDVVVSNSGTAGVALGIKVEDKISEVTAGLLNSMTSVTAFSGWTIAKPVLVGSETKTTLTSATSNINLADTVDISPGGSVTYKITATLKTSTNSEVLYGPITNKAKADNIESINTITPKFPSLNTTKVATVNSFIPGDTVSFKITVSNAGPGYANDALVKDNLNTAYFENIVINGIPSGLGTTTGITNPLNGNLDAIVDIAPGGKVEYTVVAKVKSDYTGNTVSNTVEVKDTQNNLTTSTSATITKQGGTGNLIDFIKRSNTTTFEPSGTITYYLDVANRLGSEKTVVVKDILSTIKVTYANNLALENVADMELQPAFDTWNIFRGVNNLDPTASLGSPKTDLNDTVTIPANSTVTYKIVAIVNPRVVSTQITNKATVSEGVTEIASSSLQHNIVPPGGGITREVNKSTYIPGVDTVKYTITVNSTGPGYQNNININEMIKNLSIPLIDGTSGHPFDGVFTVKKIITNETDGTEEVFTFEPTDNQNLVGIVDVKPGEKVQYVIEGLVRKDAIGTINNNGLETVPFRHNLQNTKSVSPTKYKPGEYIIYTITLKNNSSGNAQNILVTDDFSNISVLDSTGVSIKPAFTEIILDLVNSTATGFKADLGNPVITDGKLVATPDIPTNGVIVYTIKAKVSDKAVGLITNTAIVDGDAVSNQVGPSIPKISIKKEVMNFYKPDGTTVISGSYMPGGFIEYKITLKNTGFGILNNGEFVDEIGSVMTSYSTAGTTGQAFDSWTVTRISSTGASTIPDVNNSIPLGTEIPNTVAKPKIVALMDLHPGGEIVYTIKAKINEKAIGTISNTATLDGLKSTVTSSSKTPNIIHTKQVFEENGTTVKKTFLPGETIVYKIRIENKVDGEKGLGISALKNYKDTISSIVAEIAESNGSAAVPTSNVFESYTATVTTSGGEVTTINGEMNNTIDLPGRVTIASGGWIEFVITGKLKDTIIGKFTNTSIYDNNNIKTVELLPVAPTIIAKKTLTKLNGVAFVAGMTYKPGDTVEYSIEIENTGKSFFNNLLVRDNTDLITTSLSGNTAGKALESVVISAPVVTNKLNKTVLTDIKPVSGNSATNLQVEVDFAPSDVIVYTITGKIINSAIGIVPANIVVVNGKSYPSDPINPKLPVITSEKKLIAPANKIYGPNETVEYKLTIENTGEGFGDNIKIIDKISEIKTTLLNGSLGQAFVNWTVTSVITHGNVSFNNQTIFKNSLVDNVDINTEIDIAPTGKVEITIKATTSTLAVGEIINIANINNENKLSEPINPKIAEVEFYKLPLVNEVLTYTPGGDIGFRLILRNTSTDAIAKDIELKDIISEIKATSASGGLVNAFQPGWTFEVVTASGDATKYFATGIVNGQDLNTAKITLGLGETIIIRIKGKADPLAVGDITNTANAKYNGVDLGPKTVILTPLPGIAELTKKVNKADYTPGGKLIYTIVLKNVGTGYLNDVSIIDELGSITTELADGTVGKAISSFRQVTLTKTNPLTVIAQESSAPNTYKAIGDIYPGDTVTVVIEATVNPLAAGKIKNTAEIKDSLGNTIIEDTKDNSTTVDPLPAIVQILKTVDKSIYVDSDTLTYKITVGNTGTGWANGILVEDAIIEIKATINGLSSQAFESWTVSARKMTGSGEVVLGAETLGTTEKTLTPNINLSQRVSLAPMSGIEFIIAAKLYPGTTSDILNRASFKYDPTNPTNPTTKKDSNEVVTTKKATELKI
ncbi:MAG: hypothetical protein ACRCUA_02350, partial [Fusobacteriaceae bacterium]